MLPFPPSVRILVLPTTGFPEKAEVGYCSGSFCLVFEGGGVRIRWFMSFRVTAPWVPEGFMNAKGYATEVANFVGARM